jgi:hypothetical protein
MVTVPCSLEKQPLVKHPQKFGCRASRAIAGRFPDAPALGFYAGNRNKVTVLDVDSTDERILRDALNRHGHTPLVIRTASGKFHGYYRHNGEDRKIRPWREQRLPIDVLGRGLCIAPPSLSLKGTYEIIEGSLDDLDHLPVMSGLGADFYSTQKSSIPVFPTTHGAKLWEQMRDHDGRNKALFVHLARDAHYCDDFMQLVDRAQTLNDHFEQSMAKEEVTKVASSVWKMTTEGRNRFGQHGSWLTKADVDALINDPFELSLLSWLKAHNGPDSRFMVADGLAELLLWPRRKFRKARDRLIQSGRIIPLNKPSPGKAVLFRWRHRGTRQAQTRGGVC